MKEITVADLRRNCSAILERIRKTKQPIRVLHNGRAIAEIIAPTVESRPSDMPNRRKLFGSMAGTGKTLADIVSPVIDLDEAEALRD